MRFEGSKTSRVNFLRTNRINLKIKSYPKSLIPTVDPPTFNFKSKTRVKLNTCHSSRPSGRRRKVRQSPFPFSVLFRKGLLTPILSKPDSGTYGPGNRTQEPDTGRMCLLSQDNPIGSRKWVVRGRLS